MTEKENCEILFLEPDNEPMLLMVVALINSYAEQGIMLGVTADQLSKIAAQGLLAVAIDCNKNVIGSAAITFQYPDGTLEFGGWAVIDEMRKEGVGKHLFDSILDRAQGNKLVAFGNRNSAPIFKKFGAQPMHQSHMHPDAFVMCETCNCSGKELLTDGNRCVDTIFDLSSISSG